MVCTSLPLVCIFRSFAGCLCESREKKETDGEEKLLKQESSKQKQPELSLHQRWSHILWNIVAGLNLFCCDLQAWPLTLTVFWWEKVGSWAPVAFFLWVSFRAEQGVLWEACSKNLLCLFWWAGTSLAARCLLSSLWPTNSDCRTSPRLQRRGPWQHVGCSGRRSKGMPAAEHVNRCPEIIYCFLWSSDGPAELKNLKVTEIYTHFNYIDLPSGIFWTLEDEWHPDNVHILVFFYDCCCPFLACTWWQSGKHYCQSGHVIINNHHKGLRLMPQYNLRLINGPSVVPQEMII